MSLCIHLLYIIKALLYSATQKNGTALADTLLHTATDKFTVDVERGMRKLFVQLLQQPGESFLLLRRARVHGGLAILGTAANVANADTITVLALASVPLGRAVATSAAVCSLPLDGSALMDRAVEVNKVMVADAIEFPGPVPTVNVLDGDVSALRCCGAVADNLIDFSHWTCL